MSCWGTMNQQQVGVRRNLRPFLLQLGAAGQIEGPVAELRLPRGAVDLVATKLDLARALTARLKISRDTGFKF